MTEADLLTFTLPVPVVLGRAPGPGEEDKRIQYGLSQMVAHFGARSRVYNESAEAARRYRRTQDAIDSPDKHGQVSLLREDLKVLKELAESPKCGWCEVTTIVTELVPDPKGGPPRERKTKRRVNFAAHTFLPLVDAIPTP